MKVKLIPGGPEHAPHMAAILGDWVRATPWMPKLHSLDENINFCRRIAGHSLIAKAHDSVAGFLTRRDAEVQCFYLGAPWRNQGIGSALLSEAQRARPKLSLWTFAANTAARRFYARHGFAEIGGTDGDNDEGLPDIRLEWSRS